MGYKRQQVREGGLVRDARAGDGLMSSSPRITTVATAGNLTIGLDAMLGGIARFTGAAGAVTYTTPTAAAILAALPEMDIGDSFEFRLTNTAAQAATIAGGTGVTAIAGNLVVNATSKVFTLVKTSATAMDLYGN